VLATLEHVFEPRLRRNKTRVSEQFNFGVSSGFAGTADAIQYDTSRSNVGTVSAFFPCTLMIKDRR
jgi:hypothetical protein